LPSPTREKLMPVLPRSKTGSPSRGSPQKTGFSSRHGSPMKGSPQKSPKKISKGNEKMKLIGVKGTDIKYVTRDKVQGEGALSEITIL
jgi:hypothetical protein